MVLYLFVAAYVGGADEPIRAPGSGSLRWLSGLFAVVLFAELSIAMLGTSLTALSAEGAGWFAGYGTPREIGRLLLTDFLLAFEVASMLLLGAAVLARRRSGLEDPRELSVTDLFRDRQIKGTQTEHDRGTMLEAGGEPRR